MSRYRLIVSPGQAKVLRSHCAHARYAWNLAVEQQAWWRPGRRNAPAYGAQCSQLTEARAASQWLREGSQTVQQQVLRDFNQAMASFFAGTSGKPAWRKAGRNEGFRIVAVKPAHIRRLSRNTGEVWVPKAGVAAVSLVPRCPGSQVLPGYLRPGRTLAYRWTAGY
jgi:putative transposase